MDNQLESLKTRDTIPRGRIGRKRFRGRHRRRVEREALAIAKDTDEGFDCTGFA